ncbi:MAG: hypothetical protein E6Q24_07525 [Chitinophagaceae bacterium]|nr:MAG: hypothetical protein E6Q24_07525 [Chitinophagaceae bacterium]
MGLNDIELPASVLASLYPSVLVAGDNIVSPSPAPVPAPTVSKAAPTTNGTGPQWKFLGNNQRNILIVVDHSNLLHLPDEDLTFLTNMLTACKLGLGDIALLNFDHYRETGGQAILKHFKSRTVLLFGLEPISFGLPVSFPAFQVQSVTNVQYLFAPALTELSADKLLKSKLWVCLQKIFLA